MDCVSQLIEYEMCDENIESWFEINIESWSIDYLSYNNQTTCLTMANSFSKFYFEHSVYSIS